MIDLARLCERGWIPDILARFGMRHLTRKRLRKGLRGSNEDLARRQSTFVESLREGPIALATEKANAQHYEVPSRFFEMVLGPRLKYSCCLYERPDTSLPEAEEAMLALTCQRADLQDGMRLLDLGCGWGSLSLWVAQQYPTSHVTAVSNSETQRAHIRTRTEELGLENLDVVTADVVEWDTETRFDRICSIEMFEHMSNWSALLDKVTSWLTPEGKLFTHVFCHRNLGYHYEQNGGWMEKYFFTGGIMPREDLFSQFSQQVEVKQRHWVPGTHYQRTCNDWLLRQDAASESISDICHQVYGVDEGAIWVQRWRMFFMACAELFGIDGGTSYGVVHTLMGKAGGNGKTHGYVPPTRCERHSLDKGKGGCGHTFKQHLTEFERRPVK